MKNKQTLLYIWGKHMAATGIFIILVTVFFYPSVIDGKTLNQQDNILAAGMGSSQMKQYEETAQPGEFSLWSDAMFGGMPYVAGYGRPAPALPGHIWLEQPFKAIGPGDAGIILIGLVCFYILLIATGAGWWLSVAGAIAFGFASYNIIVIQAGHILKAFVIAYMPLTLAGMVLLFKNRYIPGALLFLLGVTFSITKGHIQITYYLFLLCLFIYLWFLSVQLKKKAFGEVGKITGIMALSVILAILANAGKLYSDWDLSQHSVRGKTELTTSLAQISKSVPTSGLDKNYAFEWSYGKQELTTLLIPDTYGRSSFVVPENNSNIHKAFAAKRINKNNLQFPLYWGDKPSTSGPVYFGALICFLFILGMIVIRNPWKWGLLVATLFFIFLAFGRNLAWFNDFMFYHLPLYNKFRTVETALVIPGLIVPFIAIWGLKVIFAGEVNEKKLKRAWLEALQFTGGICLLVWLIPEVLFSFRSPHDLEWFPDWLLQPILMDRIAMASADGLRSLLFILAGAGLIFWYIRATNKQSVIKPVSIGIVILLLVDFWMVDRRFINESSFIPQNPHQLYTPTFADQAILEDKESFRVLNLNKPFDETTTSYYHHSIGGFHAAKLRRYQDLMEQFLFRELDLIVDSLQAADSRLEPGEIHFQTPTLNMLNTRYIIHHPDQAPILNPYAYGNAWFVSGIREVKNPNEEIAMLAQINPLEEVVVNMQFADELQGFIPKSDSNATIELVDYRPNRLQYLSSAQSEQLAVFSEIYYQPGWRAFIDGEPAPHFRANWILRAMRIPAGNHRITFEFYPETYIVAANIEAYTSFFVLLLAIGVIGYSLWEYGIKQQKQPEVKT